MWSGGICMGWGAAKNVSIIVGPRRRGRPRASLPVTNPALPVAGESALDFMQEGRPRSDLMAKFQDTVYGPTKVHDFPFVHSAKDLFEGAVRKTLPSKNCKKKRWMADPGVRLIRGKNAYQLQSYHKPCFFP